MLYIQHVALKGLMDVVQYEEIIKCRSTFFFNCTG